jgi:hypothetical protein
MIEEFVRMLDRLRGLKQTRRWDDASRTLDEEFQRLVGGRTETILDQSETELLARLMDAGPTHALRDRALLLVRLLHEAADVAAATGREEQARASHLKALNLLLVAFGKGEAAEYPAFVPKVEVLLHALDGAALPARTHAMLMQHYERLGDYAHAEDELHALLEADAFNAALVEFGLAFYGRLLSHGDAALRAGGLPRVEVEAGLRELQERRGAGRGSSVE